MFDGNLAMSGALKPRLMKAQRAPLAWRVRNAARWSFVWGWLCNWLAQQFTNLTQIPTMTAQLAIRVRRANGEWVDYGVVSYRVVTDAAVAYMVDDLDSAAGSADVSNWQYHGAGTGTTAEDVTDTALETESTTALNPDSTRATGTGSQPSANVYRSVGTLTFDASAAITEHGILTQAATGGGVLLDRSVFSAINVGSGDSIQFTYSLTLTAGS